MEKYFNYNTWLYFIIYLALIVVFAYFYILISFDPVEVANNIQKNGGSIPGIRSGRPTVQYIKKILNRITCLGALLLTFIAILPYVVSALTGLSHSAAIGGTGIIIVVGVAMDTIKQLKSQLTAKQYRGFVGR